MSYVLTFNGNIAEPLDHLFSGNLHLGCREAGGCMRADWQIEKTCDLCGELSPGGLHRQCVLWEEFQGERWDGAFTIEDPGWDDSELDQCD